MVTREILAVVAIGLAGCASGGGAPFGSGAPAPGPGPGAAAPAPPVNPDPWPRQIQTPGGLLRVYQPQVESWHGNTLAFRAAVASTPAGSGSEAFGVVWGTAHTAVDRVSRQVALFDLKLT